MSILYISDIEKQYEKYINKEIEISAWVKTIRSSKDISFIEINDGTCFECIQVVLHKQKLDNYDILIKQNTGCAIHIFGILQYSKNKQQQYELNATSITVLGESQLDYPLQKKKHSLEFLRIIPHLRPRTNIFRAVFKIRSEAAFAIHKFFNEQGFMYIHTPILTTSDCEGAGEMFHVTNIDYKNIKSVDEFKENFNSFFGKLTNLTVSGQLDAESFAMAYSKVYTFGPTFRAENSNTTRHAAEFWMIEPEIAFADLTQNMIYIENMVKYVIKHIKNKCVKELEYLNMFVDNNLNERLNNTLEKAFPRITYTEAIELLLKSNVKFENDVYWGVDLASEHERYITDQIYKSPVFLINYPKEIKSFYMRINDDNKTVAACDLLVPQIGELVGGSQREERLNNLLLRMKELNMNVADYQQYIDLRKYGSVVHSGFGLGFERMIMYLTGVMNIRDVLPFPRKVKSII